MGNARYVDITKVTSVPFIKVASDINNVYRQQLICASDGYLTV